MVDILRYQGSANHPLLSDAERLVVELRDRLDGLAPAGTVVEISSAASAGAAAPTLQDPVAEAVNALIALGLKPPEASRRVHAVDGAGLACEEIVRRALQTMVR